MPDEEIKRLKAELDKAHKLLSQSISWQRDAEITKAKQAQEIERLQGERTQLAVERDEAKAQRAQDQQLLFHYEAELASADFVDAVKKRWRAWWWPLWDARSTWRRR